MKHYRVLHDAFPRIRDKVLFLILSIGGPYGWQLAYALAHRNKRWL